jgi:G3E family GTPase
MKNRIDTIIFTGYINSGKTSLINKLLTSNRIIKSRKTLVILYEDGSEEISLSNKENYIVEKIEKENYFNIEILKSCIKKYEPNYIIIELNGMLNIDEFLNKYKDNKLMKILKINKIINVIDGKMYEFFAKLTFNITKLNVIYSEINIVNNFTHISDEKKSNLQKLIFDIDYKSNISFAKEFDDLNIIFNEKFLLTASKKVKGIGLSNILIVIFIYLILGIIFYIVFNYY